MSKATDAEQMSKDVDKVMAAKYATPAVAAPPVVLPDFSFRLVPTFGTQQKLSIMAGPLPTGRLVEVIALEGDDPRVLAATAIAMLQAATSDLAAKIADDATWQ